MAEFDQSKLNELLSEEEEIRSRIAKLNEQMATTTGGERQRLKDLMADEKRRLKILTDQSSILEKRKEIIDYEKDALESMASLSKQDLKNISGKVSTSNVLVSITRKVIQLKRSEGRLEGDALERAQQRRETLEELKNSVIEQSQSLTSAMRKEMDDTEKRENFERSISHLTKAQKKEARDLYNIRNQLAAKEKHITALYEQQEGLLDAAPDFIQDSIGFVQKLGTALKAGTIPIVLLGSMLIAAVKYFVDLQQAGEDFRKETGMLRSQTKDIDASVNNIVGGYARLGVTASDVYGIVTEIKNEFSDITNLSETALATMAVLGKNFGISAENAAKVQGVLENIGGLSSDTAANVQLQITSMAKLAGVAPDKVFADIAESAEIASTLFKGDVSALAKAAVEARRLGTNLKSVANTAEKLLEFEGSIDDELEAAAMAGGRFNLTQARSLAYAGDMTGMQNELLNQLENEADFRNQNYFAQKALAQAAGMSVEEVTKQLNMREKLNSLTAEERKMADEAIAKGLDLTNVSEDQLKNTLKQYEVQQEQQSVLTELENTFKGIAATIGSVLNPLLEAIGPILTVALTPLKWAAQLMQMIVDNGWALLPILGAIAVAYGRIAVKQSIALGKSLATAIANIFTGAGPLGPAGWIGAGVAVAGLTSLVMNALKVGDLSSPADGKTMVSTKEGGLYQLSPNDDIVAAPGLARGLAETASATTSTTNTSVIQSSNVDILLAPLNNLLVQIQGLRADLNAGKIAIHMDGQKVTSGISKVVDRSSTNSYSLG